MAGAIAVVPLAIFFNSHSSVRAAGPALIDPNLDVRTVVSGLEQPTTMAFLGANDFLVLEKASGQVKRVIGGVVQSTPVLDLAVNSGSERGLLGIALHPDFPRNRGVYLYWTESTATNAAGQLIDSDDLSKTPLLGNRVDRFVWNGSTLTFDKNLIHLRALQEDATNPAPRGNHNSGIICFERRRDDDDDRGDRDDRDDRDGRADRKRRDRGAREDGDDDDDDRDKARLFILIGDNGRRGQLQNLLNGPFGPNVPDDQFGGLRRIMPILPVSFSA